MTVLLSPLKAFDKKEKTHAQSKLKFSEESQITVHMLIRPQSEKRFLRLWKTIFLFAHESDHRSRLNYFENISFYPQWTELPPNKSFHFTLIFSGLPKGCKKFDLIELIPQPGGFMTSNISRNNDDVYHIEL